MKIAGGIKEEGIIVGNNYDKYGSKNPVVKWIMKGFDNNLSKLVKIASPQSIHEVGCGEGYWVIKWQKKGIDARGSDFSSQIIEIARQNAIAANLSKELFQVKSIYDIEKVNDGAELLVCCEVMEHLENPKEALKALESVVGDYLIVSVPREPIWSILNLARAKYITNWGNTPGHIQHWSSSAFVRLIGDYFDIVEVRKPLPWTMILCKKR